MSFLAIEYKLSNQSQEEEAESVDYSEKKQKKKKSDGGGDAHHNIIFLDESLIMCEILTRLPIKSLFRFKLVCKKWHNLITEDPLFIMNYNSHNRTNLSTPIFYCSKPHSVFSSDQYYQFKLPNLSFVYGVTEGFLMVGGATNGLVYGHFLHQTNEILVFNPITKHVVHVPNPFPCGGAAFALAYDPYNNPNFGFKLVSFLCPLWDVHDDPNKCYQFQVYSSKTGEWRISNNAKLAVPSCQLLRRCNPVYTGGKVFWSLVTHIAWFDIEEDAAGLITCPRNDNLVFRHRLAAGSYIAIGACNDQLSYSIVTKEGDIEIWLLRNIRRGKWVKRHNMRLQGIFEQNWNITSEFCKANRNAIAKSFAHEFVYPLPYVGGEEVWFWMIIIREGVTETVFSINLRTQELKVFTDVPFPLCIFTPTLHPCPT